MENDNQVNMELDLEFLVLIRGTGVRCWEEHVEWDLKIRKYVAIGDLNILNLCRVSLSFERLDTH